MRDLLQTECTRADQESTRWWGTDPNGPRLGLHGRRPLSRFVGRDRELALLCELLPQVEGGRGQMVGMIGEPGVGSLACVMSSSVALSRIHG